jgi:hypothetical protein
VRVFRVAVVVWGAMFASCLDPTEIEVVVSTDVACNVVTQNGVAIAIGKPGDDSIAAAGNTHDCSSDGGIGTLVVLPHGIGDSVGIRVMLGVDASVENCDESHAFAGCIVARRSVSFIPHRPLTLPIELQSSCIGKICDPSSTCFNGTCVDAGVTCDGGACELPDSGGPPPPTCRASGPTPVIASALPNTPHLARLPGGGWLVTYVVGSGSAKSLFGSFIDSSGVAGNPTVISSLPSSQGVTGPLGTDGETVLTFFFDSSPTPLSRICANFDGGGGALSGAGAAPLDGVIPLGGGLYDSLFTNATTTQIYTVNANKNAIQSGTLPSSINLTTASGLGLARAGSTTFISYANTTDNTCHVAGCVGGTCSDFVSSGNCPIARTAVASETTWAAMTVVSGAPLFNVHAGSSTNNVGINIVLAQPSAAIPLVTSTAFYAFTRDTSESLSRTDFAQPTPVLVVSKLGYTAAGGNGAGFDVLADDPVASTGYALVYWSGGSVIFEHFCP